MFKSCVNRIVRIESEQEQRAEAESGYLSEYCDEMILWRVKQYNSLKDLLTTVYIFEVRDLLQDDLFETSRRWHRVWRRTRTNRTWQPGRARTSNRPRRRHTMPC